MTPPTLSAGDLPDWVSQITPGAAIVTNPGGVTLASTLTWDSGVIPMPPSGTVVWGLSESTFQPFEVIWGFWDDALAKVDVPTSASEDFSTQQSIISANLIAGQFWRLRVKNNGLSDMVFVPEVIVVPSQVAGSVLGGLGFIDTHTAAGIAAGSSDTFTPVTTLNHPMRFAIAHDVPIRAQVIGGLATSTYVLDEAYSYIPGVTVLEANPHLANTSIVVTNIGPVAGGWTVDVTTAPI